MFVSEFDPGEPFKSLIPSVLLALALVLVFWTGLIIYKCRRRAGSTRGSTRNEVNDKSSSDNFNYNTIFNWL